MFLSEKERTETILACRFCPMCNVADRLAQVVKRESFSPRGRAAILFALERGMLAWEPAVAEIMYTTLNDGLLREWCVGHYDHEELVLDARARLFAQGLAPEEIRRFAAACAAGEGQGPQPAALLAGAGLAPASGAALLVYAGGAARRRPAGLLALARLLAAAGVAYQVLDPEPPSGFDLYQAGDLAGAVRQAGELAAALRGSGAARVVSLDADEHRMLNTRLARLGGELGGMRVGHYSACLAELLAAGRIGVSRPVATPLTYHDPAALARYAEELEAPRAVLRAAAGEAFREMDPAGKLAGPSGGEGLLPWYRPELAARVAALRVAEARRTGAGLLVSACPRAELALADPAGEGLEVLDLAELLARAVGLA